MLRVNSCSISITNFCCLHCLSAFYGVVTIQSARALFKTQRSFSVPTTKEQKTLDENDPKVTLSIGFPPFLLFHSAYLHAMCFTKEFKLGKELIRSQASWNSFNSNRCFSILYLCYVYLEILIRALHEFEYFSKIAS